VAERSAYKSVSFAIEPIQPPIVPLRWFSLKYLRTTAPRKRGADRSADGYAAAAQSGAQSLEVRELAELRRQRAVQAIRPQVPATARGKCCAVPRGECPSHTLGTQSRCYRRTLVLRT
jgi:hypothetical protein